MWRWLPGGIRHAADISAGMVTHLLNRGAIAAKYFARHFLSVEAGKQSEKIDNVFRLPGAGNPAGGLNKQEYDVARRRPR